MHEVYLLASFSRHIVRSARKTRLEFVGNLDKNWSYVLEYHLEFPGESQGGIIFASGTTGKEAQLCWTKL